MDFQINNMGANISGVKNAIDFMKTGELPSSDMSHTMAAWNPTYAWMLYNTENRH